MPHYCEGVVFDHDGQGYISEGETIVQFSPDGKSIVAQTKVIPELVGTWSKSDLAAMKKEIKRRKDSKMTARVTENRQYRYFDAWLTDNLASRLLVINVATKEFRDLTPKRDYLFGNGGDAGFAIAPDGKSIALVMTSTPPPDRKSTRLNSSHRT